MWAVADHHRRAVVQRCVGKSDGIPAVDRAEKELRGVACALRRWSLGTQMHGDNHRPPTIDSAAHMAPHGIEIARIRTVARRIKTKDGDGIAATRYDRRRERVGPGD